MPFARLIEDIAVGSLEPDSVDNDNTLRENIVAASDPPTGVTGASGVEGFSLENIAAGSRQPFPNASGSTMENISAGNDPGPGT